MAEEPLSSQLKALETDVEQLIKEQRQLRLLEGARFIKYGVKGGKVKDKYWYCKVPPNYKTFHYGEVDDVKAEKTVEELPNKFNISDIKKILTGKECPHMKDGHFKKTTQDLAITIVYESESEEILNLVALEYRAFNCWTDGLNSLLGRPMVSDAYRIDLKILKTVQAKIARDLHRSKVRAESDE